MQMEPYMVWMVLVSFLELIQVICDPFPPPVCLEVTSWWRSVICKVIELTVNYSDAYKNFDRYHSPMGLQTTTPRVDGYHRIWFDSF